MQAFNHALKYCYYTIGQVFYEPGFLLLLILSAFENLVVAGLTLAVATIVVYFLGLEIWGLFLIGLLMAFYLSVYFYLYQLLKARASAIHQTHGNHQKHRSKLPALAWPVLTFTFHQLSPWKRAESRRWQNGDHLILPLMTANKCTYQQAEQQLLLIKLSEELHFDPRQVAVRPLTTFFCVLATVVGGGLGLWLGFATSSGIVVSFTRRIFATGLAILAFLITTWLPVVLSAIKNGLYQADLLDVEISEKNEFLPQLLEKSIGRAS